MRTFILLLLAAALALGGGSAAWAAPRVDTAQVHLIVGADGVVDVETVLAVSDVSEVTWRLAKTRDIDAENYYRYTYDGLPAGANDEGDHIRVATPVAEGQARLRYRVRGATFTAAGEQGPLTLAQWPVVAGLELPVADIRVTTEGPAAVQLIDCLAGPPGSVGSCAAITGGTFENPQPSFQDGPRAAGEEVVVTVGYLSGQVATTAAVEQRWSLDRAFELSWTSLLVALGTALAGAGLWYLLHRRIGRDLGDGAVIPVATFSAAGAGQLRFTLNGKVRPGHVGTVADERVDPIDVTATLLDLASRGHLRIVELPAATHGLRDWRLERTQGGDELARFEELLLAGVAPQGQPTKVSQLPTALAGCVAKVQDALYDDVVAAGWFETRPDATRSWWRIRGFVGLAVAIALAVLLVAFTRFGLAALMVVGFGIAGVWLADRMPRRTAAGAGLLRGLEALAYLLATQPTDQLPKGQELTEISRLLGYAVVLGGKERWLAAMVEMAQDDAGQREELSWYQAPQTWQLQDLPASLTQFIHTVQGVLTAR